MRCATAWSAKSAATSDANIGQLPDSPPAQVPYNGTMTTTARSSSQGTRPGIPGWSGPGTFLDGLAAQNFDRLASAVRDDVHLSALLPRGFMEWDGAGAVKAAFTRWFGDVDRFEFIDATAGEVGPRLHLRWRVRVQAERLGAGWFVVEQQAYADTDAADRIQRLSLLCSGYCPEGAEG